MRCNISHSFTLYDAGRLPVLVLVHAFVIVMLTGCAASGKPGGNTTSDSMGEAQPTDISTTQRFNAVMMEANLQRILGNTSAYYDLLDHALMLSPNAPDAVYNMGIVHSFLEQNGMATDTVGFDMVKRAVSLDPRNTTYLQTLVNIYLRQDSIEQALTAIERLTVLQPHNSDALSTLINLYEYTERYQDAIDRLNRLEVINGKSLAVSYRKFKNYKQMEMDEEAYAEIESLCREFPYEPNYHILLGELLTRDKRYDEALEELQRVQAADPLNAGLQMPLLNLCQATRPDSVYQAMRDSILFSPLTESVSRRDIIIRYCEDMDNKPNGDSLILAMFDSLKVVQGSDISLLQLYASYLAQHEQSKDKLSPRLVRALERIVDLAPYDNKDLFFTLIQYYGENQQYERLEDICRKGVITFPDELLCHFYLGIACYQQEHKAEALKAFQDGVKHKTAGSNPAIVAELFGVMGDLLHDLGYPNSQTYAAYDSSLVYKPDNASYLNNYAYYLSLDNAKLDMAEEMSYRSLRLEPDNKTYLDTYAWILFTKKRYVEAQAYIDRVCPPAESDSTLLQEPSISGVVFEHAGDIAAMNDNIDQALRFWLLALSVGSSDLSATLPRKIKQKKYIQP